MHTHTIHARVIPVDDDPQEDDAIARIGTLLSGGTPACRCDTCTRQACEDAHPAAGDDADEENDDKGDGRVVVRDDTTLFALRDGIMRLHRTAVAGMAAAGIADTIALNNVDRYLLHALETIDEEGRR
ncbi:hypothetical protein [Bifidobacterium samirii]|uniref:Uncharacterized protein n=1 Tax=Bifidobacterium samirii TaxID=2306974 RepID=A0A430FJU2_9BIFI|nr:hypothetical protein [Bifidobacterium samirii]RSX52998.1 hypothetical protein D2E24_1669 [Bifidobacterium samirii]